MEKIRKVCRKCGLEKPISEFSRTVVPYKNKKYVYYYQCKLCVNKHDREYRRENREHFNEYSKMYWKNNSEFRSARKKIQKKYRQEHREQYNQYSKNHMLNRSMYLKKLYHNNRRRVLRKKSSGWHSLEEWEQLKKQYLGTCPSCGRKEPEVILTEDHIIPLSRGGTDSIENIQPLCKSCNSRKNTGTKKYEVYSK